MRRLAEQQPYDEQKAYKYLQHVIAIMHRTGAIRTEVYGAENLPKEGGYVMYPNHQGKYDGYAIVYGHKMPCSVVMDRKRSYLPFIREVMDLVKGKRMELDNMRQSLSVINEVAAEVARGRKFMIFPEGGYSKEKRNDLWDFKSGCFKTSVKSRTPIVPVVIFDTYRAFDIWYPGLVRTKVFFLEPIPYEVYKNMNTKEIAQMVRNRIQKKMDEILA